MRNPPCAQRGELLVAILKEPSDLAILQEQSWYRVPVDKAPRRWPPQWLAFYHTKAFGEELAYSVQYYGEVGDIRVRKRHELFPREFQNSRSERTYYQVFLKQLLVRAAPIHSTRPRRLIFVPSTWNKFERAAQVNDLFDDSPIEDSLWQELKIQKIAAERQWNLMTRDGQYALDFALFCQGGSIDVETDGHAWHVTEERAAKDYPRDNAVAAAGWNLLRFSGQQIRESAASYCVPRITELVNRLGGLSQDGIVPREFHLTPDGLAQQLSLLESEPDYDA